MDRIEELICKVQSYYQGANIPLLKKAIDFTIKAHEGQKRESGEPYYYHPIEVAHILAEMRLDLDSIITGLLHDTVEDTFATLEQIRIEFGENVSRLVDGVTKLTKIKFQPEHIRQAENFRKLLLATSEDIRVLIVKLADRTHNMRTLEHVSQKKKLRIAHETMEIYAPLAERIGIQKMKNELQDLSFKFIHPDVRESIINRLKYLKAEGGKRIIDRIIKEIITTIKDSEIEAEIYGREKSPCSIWYKMEKKRVSFEQLSDIIAFRIIVNTIPECYLALGAIHNRFHMIPESFKDFISTPKSNGYQSLHTVIIGPEKQIIEIQIRTKEMHEVAELGVAAHWSYKQGRPHEANNKQYKWIRELLSYLEKAGDPEDFLEHTKLEMQYDQVFCFTPKGNLIALNKNSTPVDFAYAVHSKVGHTCIGCKVNGHIVPLRTVLHNGDQVEIICSEDQSPSPTWLEFVVTGKAKSEIKRFITNQRRQEYLNLGRMILLKNLDCHNEEELNKKLSMATQRLSRANVEDLMVSVGEGKISKEEVNRVLNPEKSTDRKHGRKRKVGWLANLLNRKRNNSNFVPIKGLIPGVAVHYADCCHPLPGDKIIGILHKGKGVIVHTVDCDILSNFGSQPESWLEISWDKELSNSSHVGRIKISALHEIGSLAQIANIISQYKGNINNLRVATRSLDYFDLIIDVEVKGTSHLKNIIKRLKNSSFVNSVKRVKS